MIPIQTRVRNKETGETGVTCPTFWGLLNDEMEHPVSVCYDNQEGSYTLNLVGESALEVIGPEDAIPDIIRCGAGKGADSCIYLVANPDGFVCERYGNLRWALKSRKMSAQRKPVEPYPDCMLGE
jgi:hypothetical protein